MSAYLVGIENELKGIPKSQDRFLKNNFWWELFIYLFLSKLNSRNKFDGITKWEYPVVEQMLTLGRNEVLMIRIGTFGLVLIFEG